MNFAIVDIETTGLYHQGHAITEIAVVHVDNGQCKLVFHSLIKPNRTIPTFISHLTGIDAEILRLAPKFRDIADQLLAVLENRIFVAHSVNFDYHFLKASFEQVSRSFKAPRLCTMRLTRRLFPRLNSYSLAAVLDHLKISNQSAHRALGDAEATAKLLCSLMTLDRFEIIYKQLYKNSGEAILPAALDRKHLADMPDGPGIYYFYGNSKKPIYIGKAKKLKKRVLSHFISSGSSKRKQLFQKEVMRVSCTPTRNEYEALLLEDAEIKQWWPKYNYAQKERTAAYAVLPYIARSNETRMAIIKTHYREDALAWFLSINAAKNWMYNEMLNAGIPPSRAGLTAMDDIQIDRSEDDEVKMRQYISNQKTLSQKRYLLISDERNANTSLCVMVKNGKYFGFGSCSGQMPPNFEQLENDLRRAPDSFVAQSVIRKMLGDENITKYVY